MLSLFNGAGQGWTMPKHVIGMGTMNVVKPIIFVRTTIQQTATEPKPCTLWLRLHVEHFWLAALLVFLTK